MARRVKFMSTVALVASCLFFGIPAYAGTAAQEHIVITDLAGRQVPVPKTIERIVPLGGALRYVVYLQGFDKVAGIEALEQKKPVSAGRVYSLAIENKTTTIPAIGEGGPGRLPDYEKVMSLRPDVIIALGTDIAQVETIAQKTGIPVVVLSSGDDALDNKDIRASLRLLGRLLGKTERAEQLIAFMDACERDLRSRTARAQSHASVYAGAIGYKGRHGVTSTDARYAPLQWLNGFNVAGQTGQKGHIFIDPEQLLVWDPETIYLDTGGLEMVSGEYQKNPELFRKLRAVRNSKVFSVLPYNFYHTNIEIAYADAYYIGKTLYPEQFRDLDPVRKADEIFRFFTGVAAYGRLKEEMCGFGTIDFTDSGLVVR
jgi:iron complex transport system substrate-binding protein